MPFESDTSRREFLHGSLAAVGSLSAASLVRADEGDDAPNDQKAAEPPLPTRKLGRSGIPVSILNQGCAVKLTARLLDYAYSRGVRYFDTADCYGRGQSEKTIARWFEKTGKRKEIFLVTKCHPHKGPAQMLDLLDERLEALKTDYIDLLFMHALCDDEYPAESVDWVKSDEYKQTAEKLKQTGKVKLVGFSIHADARAQALMNAAEAGFVDAIMVKYDPRTAKDDKMNRALDACAKAGIGLIAMKTQSSAKAFEERWKKHKQGDWTVQQAVVKAVLSDDRLAGMTSHMENLKQIDQNTAAARDVKPLARADHDLLMRLYAEGPHRLCECGGGCAEAVGRPSALHDVARFVMYHDLYGRRDWARDGYRSLRPELIDLSAEELHRAKAACGDAIDYPAIFARARTALA